MEGSFDWRFEPEDDGVRVTISIILAGCGAFRSWVVSWPTDTSELTGKCWRD
jgi:hypothetical protein